MDNGKWIWILTDEQKGGFSSFLEAYYPEMEGPHFTDYTDPNGNRLWLLPLQDNEIWEEYFNEYDEGDGIPENDYRFEFWTASNLPSTLWP